MGCLHRQPNISGSSLSQRPRSFGLLRLASKIQSCCYFWIFRILSSICVWEYPRRGRDQDGICSSILIYIFYRHKNYQNEDQLSPLSRMLAIELVLFDELILLCLQLLLRHSSLRIKVMLVNPINLAPLQIGNLFNPADVISIYPLPKQESKNLSFYDLINLTSKVAGSSGMATKPRSQNHSTLLLTPTALALYLLDVNLQVLLVEHFTSISQ